MLKINCKVKKSVGKANKRINVEKIISLNNLNIKRKKGKFHRISEVQCRGRGL